MTDDWWNDIYESAAFDLRDAYIQRLLDEFRYLSEKENKTNAAPDTPSFGDETS